MTLFSMTGFTNHTINTQNGLLSVELRTVNHRYLELQIKLEDPLRDFEAALREQLNAGLARGKVECRVSLKNNTSNSTATQIDTVALQDLLAKAAQIQALQPQAATLTIAELLRWPGVLSAQNTPETLETLEAETFGLVLNQAVQAALIDLNAARAREGEKLKAVILVRLSEIEAIVAQLKPLMPLQVKAYQAKLLVKLQEVMQTVDDERIRQELVLFAQRIDVDEELERLSAHMSEVQRILSVGGACGKKLDFLMQELNREANTLGSKSVSVASSQAAMQLKVLIEQMREQIQNIE